jgi:NADPH:quinone reductase-like Zn-dependent oxidoreductase
MVRAISVSEYRADAQLGEHETPTAGPGQVLVKVQAAGMNPMDQAIASGAFSDAIPASFPLILGVDVAGVIEAVGDGPVPYAIGNRVFGQLLAPPLGASGAYADYAVVAADATVAPVPDALSSEVAATLPTPGVTALQLARSLEPLVANAVVVIIGAGGVVGGFLTQLLVAAGARVLAVALPPQADRVRGYGAQEMIDGTATPTDQIRRAAPTGVDVLVDLVSDSERFAALSDTVRSDGTAVSTRYVADIDGLAKQNIHGVNFVVQMTTADLQTIAGLTASGELMPPPIRTVGLEEVPDLLNVGGNRFDGKTVVRPEHS